MSDLPDSPSTPAARPEAPPDSLMARLRRVAAYFGTAPRLWAYAVLATLVGALTEAAIPALLKPLLDRGFTEGTLPLWTVPVGVLVMFFLRGGAQFAAQYMLSVITNDGMLKLRNDMFTRLLNAELGLFARQSASSLSNTVVFEVQTGASMLVQALMSMSRDGFTLIALVCYLLYLNWQLTMVVVVLAPGMSWVMRKLSKRLYGLTKEAQKSTDDLAYVVEENVLAHRMVRLHGAQEQQQQRFAALSKRLRSLLLKSTVAHSAMTPLTQSVAAVALSAVLSIALWQAQAVQGAERAVTVGAFASFVTAMLMLVAPIRRLADIASPITRGVAALERGLQMLENVPTETDTSTSSSTAQTLPTRARGEIELRDVLVRYQPHGNTGHSNGSSSGNSIDSNAAPQAADAHAASDDEQAHTPPALQHINLHIAPGEVVAFVGQSGAGKTTLVNLLPRFVLPTSGQILLDGTSISDWPLAQLRAQIAMVSQDVVMLNQSIAANVALGRDIDRAQVQAALEAANLASHIAKLPQGIDTVVGHNATQLSGGQRQRLAIARAIYKDAPILLLDEATSALDNESERLVQEALQRLMQGRTTLIVAHRLSTIEHADRVVVMEGGCIVEQGSHAELLQRGGVYARLHHR
jgi:subfamily B ATP-binding cassette protein MsbA